MYSLVQNGDYGFHYLSDSELEGWKGLGQLTVYHLYLLI